MTNKMNKTSINFRKPNFFETSKSYQKDKKKIEKGL